MTILVKAKKFMKGKKYKSENSIHLNCCVEWNMSAMQAFTKLSYFTQLFYSVR